MTDKVKVAVRLRPFNRREIELGAKCVVDMDSYQTVLYNPGLAMKDGGGESGPTKSSPKTFAFDHCFWSMAENHPKYSSQEKVFKCLGVEVLDRAFEGYNACIFAYGQTGSGKSYSMMGTVEQRGIIPRLCDSLFDRITASHDAETSFKVEVSYMEIYNEKVRDLLDPKGKHNLKVREHNILGPYVDGLSTLAVSSFEDIDNLMCEGNKSRTVAATNMNSESSRSHAVFNIIMTQTLTDLQTGVSGEKVSKISLVDLAGSERAQKTGAVGDRLKEGSNINKSLTTLGLVISALADQSSGKAKTKFVPYRDSVLTWLLKDNLGGNSKTVMVATLSPAADNYEETLSTLRYADRAKRIVNHAVVNEDPNARIIRELREEVEMLRKMLSEAQSLKSDDLRERLEESEKLMNEMEKTWEDKLKETERIHMERHAALEKMGISVQTSGIKVEHCRYYLVNLNADPSLNELLVYYLKERTLIGRPDATQAQDIQLLGLGIMSQHCVISLEGTDVYLEPFEGARTCVNGRTVTSRTKLKNGDRILWGNNHFFRVNCPKANSPSSDVPENIDYDFAQQELMLQQMEDDPIQSAIRRIEKQHEEDKQEALEKQKQIYEYQMNLLRSQLMSPSTPSVPYPFDPFAKTPTGTAPSTLHPKYQQWERDREALFRQSLVKLKEDVVKANTMVQEANFLVQEMHKPVEFSVTLQIPVANLSPNRRRGGFISEPAVFVKYKGKGSRVWSMDKFENKLFDMRDVYQERKDKGLPLQDDTHPEKDELFCESQENHSLIGVANLFLEALFYDVKLDYHVPIISQQGEVAGRLHVELCRVSGSLVDRSVDDSASESSSDTLPTTRNTNGMDGDEESTVSTCVQFVCQVAVKEARGLPPALSNYVYCQYSFWGCPDPIYVRSVVPEPGSAPPRRRLDEAVVVFDDTREFTVNVNDDFAEYCADGALSFEVWGNRSSGFSAFNGWQIEQMQAKSRSIADRWTELTRKIELWVEVHELNEQGFYSAVEVTPRQEVPTGGVYQLRQGHSRRLCIRIKPVHNSGTLPIICESINQVAIGCICARSKLQKGLDSYQELDLSILRDKWSDVLAKRRDYLDDQLQKIMSKEDKTDADTERERSLIDQWVCLTEERNAVLVPTAGSGIPGAPAEWEHPPGMEQHIPVIFLDLSAEDMTSPNVKEGDSQPAGYNSILPKELNDKLFTLPVYKTLDNEVGTVVLWDSSVHDSIHLNRVTPNNERVYLIVKVVVQLSHPAAMEIVLRKRLCINVYKRQSITERLRRKIGKMDCLTATGVTYEIVSNIPQASEDLEDRESLAQIAASQNEQAPAKDGETYIEKYIKGVSAVDSILALDRLRQEVAIKELMSVRGRPIRKATSVPNIHNILMSPQQGFQEQMRSDSIQDLSFGRESDRFGSLPKHISDSFHLRPSSGAPGDMQKDVPAGLSACPAGVKPGLSPAQTAKKTLTTLVEEQVTKTSNQRSPDNESESESTLDSKESTPTPQSVMAVHACNETEPSENATSSVQQHEAKQNVEVCVESPEDESADKKLSPAPGTSSSGYSSLVGIDDLSASSKLDNAAEELELVADDCSVEKSSVADECDPAASALRHQQPGKAETENNNIGGDASAADQVGVDVPTASSLSCSGLPNCGDSDSMAVPNHVDLMTDSSVSQPDIVGSVHSCVDNELSIVGETDFTKGTVADVVESADDSVPDVLQASVIPAANLVHEQQSSGSDSEHCPLKKLPPAHPSSGKMKPRTSDKSVSKPANAPVKATYHPIPMPGEMTIVDDKDQSFESQDEVSELDSTADLSSVADASAVTDDDSVSVCSFGSRADLHRLSEAPLPSWCVVGEPVHVIVSQGGSRSGHIQFTGPTEFAPGTWVGVELDTADGKNDGSVKGVRYFRCRNQHGVFVRHDKLVHDKKRSSLSAASVTGKSTASSSKVAGKVPSNLRRSTGNLSGSSGGVSSLMKPTAASSAKHK